MEKNKNLQVLLNTIPILLMIGCIPLFENDYVLTIVYIMIICISFFIKKEKKEIKLFFLGFMIMIFSEFVFTSTKVEVFERNTLFGLMPLWLPFLWGYCFVVMKRFIKIFEF